MTLKQKKTPSNKKNTRVANDFSRVPREGRWSGEGVGEGRGEGGGLPPDLGVSRPTWGVSRPTWGLPPDLGVDKGYPRTLPWDPRVSLGTLGGSLGILGYSYYYV